MKNQVFICATVILIFSLFPDPVWAYIGPGAGFALLSSFFALLISFFLALVSLFTLPFRLLLILFKKKKTYKKSLFKRIIVLGFDGLDPDLCKQFIKQNKMPNFESLKKMGDFKNLASTIPALSPVAWSTFSTGVNPGRHRIFDFLQRNPNTYLPELSSAKIIKSRKTLKLWKLTIPLKKQQVNFLRKSQSFWKIVGKHGIFSHIIRVPISFPPEKFHGALLSAMCTPDLRGTQGTFSYFTTRDLNSHEYTSGNQYPLETNGTKISGYLTGPESTVPHVPLKTPFQLNLNKEQKKATLQINGTKTVIELKRKSPWIKVIFKNGFIKVHGICQFYLKQISPYIDLYVSPLNIDPEKPALPISHPYFFAPYLAKLFGRFSTLGLAEDTWALNEEVLDEDAFLEQAYQIQQEREDQFFHAVDKTKKGLCACVFDTTDRIQHMFYRYLNNDAHADHADFTKYKDVIPKLYQQADKILGRLLNQIDQDTLLFVMSDHGFKSFVRGINLNSWLYHNNYLKLVNDDFGVNYLKNVDWEHTQAYAIGLAGIYLNLKGREKFGTVSPGRSAQILKDELIAKLSNLKDPEYNKIAINQVFDSQKVYSGPYSNEAPDLIIGYNDGYRISWEGATGVTTREIFSHNTKKWSGDHGIDPSLVDGILYCNHKINNNHAGIIDLAPTILDQFGIKPPQYMEGKPLKINRNESDNHDSSKN